MGRLLRRVTLKWKIFVYLLGFCAILLVILWLFQTVLLDSFYRSVKVMEIKNGAGLLAANIESGSLTSYVSTVSQNGAVSVDIVSEAGDDLAVSSEMNNIFRRMPPEEKLRLLSSAASNGGDYTLYDTAQNDPHPGNVPNRMPFGGRPTQSIVYVRLIRLSSGVTEAVLLGAQISPVNATVTTLRYQLYIITAVLIALSILLALLIARRVSKPLVEITKGAKKLAAGDYGVTFGGKGFREIGELSETLNTAARELSKVEGQRRELMANISHDLRTPLALIYSYAEVLHDFPDEITPDKTQVIMDETRRLSSLVGDILDLTRLESGASDLNRAPFSLTRSLEETTNRVAELVRRDGYSIAFSGGSDVYVEADEKKITQVFYNLLLNAIHYTGPDKTIDIRQTVSGGTVRIEVSDTGEGYRARGPEVYLGQVLQD